MSTRPVMSDSPIDKKMPTGPSGQHSRGRSILPASLWQGLVIICCAVLAYELFTSGYDRLIACTTLVNIVLALSLGLATQTNRISLAQAALAGVGAYTSAYLALQHGVNPWLAIVAGAIVAVIIGLGLGLLALRLRGFYFAIATLAFSEIFAVVVSGWTNVTGGLGGLTGLPPLTTLPLGFTTLNYSFDIELTAYYWTLLALVVVALIIAYLFTGSSRIGRRVRAVGDDEVLAASVGVASTLWRTTAFATGALLAGLAGGFNASLLGGTAPSSYDTFTSVSILAMVFIGGRRSVSGAVVGAVILTVVPEALKFSADLQLLFFGAFFLISAFVFPNGIVPTLGDLVRRAQYRRDVTPTPDAAGKTI